MADEQKEFEENIKKYLKKVESDDGYLNMTELNQYISAHSSRLTMKSMRTYCKNKGIILDAYRKTNKGHLIKTLWGDKRDEFKNITFENLPRCKWFNTKHLLKFIIKHTELWHYFTLKMNIKDPLDLVYAKVYNDLCILQNTRFPKGCSIRTWLSVYHKPLKQYMMAVIMQRNKPEIEQNFWSYYYYRKIKYDLKTYKIDDVMHEPEISKLLDLYRNIPKQDKYYNNKLCNWETVINQVRTMQKYLHFDPCKHYIRSQAKYDAKQSKRENQIKNTEQYSEKKDVMEDEEIMNIVHDLGTKLEGQDEIKELFGTLLDRLNR